MIYLLIALLLLQGAALAFFWGLNRKLEDQPEPMGPTTDLLYDLKSRMEVLELRWKRVLDELEERVERGNIAWRRYRAGEAARSRRQELEEDEGATDEEEAPDVHQVDAFGGDPRGLSYMPESLGNAPEPPWKTVSRQLAAQIAGKEVS